MQVPATISPPSMLPPRRNVIGHSDYPWSVIVTRAKELGVDRQSFWVQVNAHRKSRGGALMRGASARSARCGRSTEESYRSMWYPFLK